MENIPALPVSESSAVLPPSTKKRHLLRSWFLGIGGALILGGGVAAYFVLGVSNPAAGIPIPNIDGSLAFRVPEASLMANATYTREDGQIVHYIDKPSVIERAWTEKNHHIIIRFTDAFGLVGEVDPQSVILGEAFTTFCQSDVTHVKDAWYYVYTTPTFEKEKTGEFPPERFRLGNCKNILQSFADRYNATPTIKSGDLVYVAIPPAEVEKLENATDRQGSSVTLSAATSTDKDMDGLLDLTETQIGSNPELFDTDADGLSDGLEVAGGNYRVMISGEDRTRNLAAYTLSWSNPDTDHDGLRDATELGLTVSQDPHPERSTSFVADADPLTVTNPAMEDTDSGGSKDGEEDANANGMVDDGETDPNNREDDLSIPLPPPPGDSCKNGLDDDGDMLIDLLDAGCSTADDKNEGDGLTDLEVQKTGPGEAANGSKVTYTITVTNKGPDAITSEAAVADHVPEGLEYIDTESDAACLAMTNNNTIHCGGIKLAKDASVAFALVFRVNATATADLCGINVRNKAFVTDTPQGDPNDANNESGVTTTLTCGTCDPIVCSNGSTHPSCDANGNPINYLVDPCNTTSDCDHDAIVDPNEECDFGPNNNSCHECRLTICGDMLVQQPNFGGQMEECDDGNQINTDGCTNECKEVAAPPPVCGNGIEEGDEECDEGDNVQEGGTCTSRCTKTFCGDRAVQNPNGNGEAEECDEDSPICTDDCKDVDLPKL